MMRAEPIGLYVHIPYCIRKCAYCDFCSLPTLGGSVPDSYVDSLIKEARTYRSEERIPISTLYFGGGTPSLLTPVQLDRLLSSFAEIFDFSNLCEVTTEANPGTLDRDKLLAFRSLGINRLSIGLQSIHENELKILGRIHTFEDFLNSYNTAREVGFDNVSVDLMYGIPEQTADSFRQTLRTVASLNPEHISAYGLIIEEGTPFFDKQSILAIPDEDTECEMYRIACFELESKGYSHYEISNYARAGRESLHNLKYWRAEEYIGLGVSAYSYFNGERYGNHRNVDAYISADRQQYISDGILTPDDEEYEYAMMRLRLREGFSLSEYRSRFGRDFLEGKSESVLELSSRGLVKIEQDRFSLTEEGFYLSNSILVQIL